MFSLESPHRGDSNENTQYTIFNMQKKKISLNYPTSAVMGFFQGTQKLVRKDHGKQASSVRATELLLYYGVGPLYLARLACISGTVRDRSSSLTIPK